MMIGSTTSTTRNESLKSSLTPILGILRAPQVFCLAGRRACLALHHLPSARSSDTHVARIIAMMPARIAFGSFGQTSITSAKSASNSSGRAPTAPDTAPLWSLIPVFPAFSLGVRFLSSPLRFKTPVASCCKATICDGRLSFVPVTETNTGTNNAEIQPSGRSFSALRGRVRRCVCPDRLHRSHPIGRRQSRRQGLRNTTRQQYYDLPRRRGRGI